MTNKVPLQKIKWTVNQEKITRKEHDIGDPVQEGTGITVITLHGHTNLTRTYTNVQKKLINLHMDTVEDLKNSGMSIIPNTPISQQNTWQPKLKGYKIKD